MTASAGCHGVLGFVCLFACFFHINLSITLQTSKHFWNNLGTTNIIVRWTSLSSTIKEHVLSRNFQSLGRMWRFFHTVWLLSCLTYTHLYTSVHNYGEDLWQWSDAPFRYISFASGSMLLGCLSCSSQNMPEVERWICCWLFFFDGHSSYERQK